MKHRRLSTWMLISLIWMSSCNGFLEEKPEKSILVPQTTEDVRALLDLYTSLNDNPLLSFILADDWRTTDSNWAQLNPWEQNAYLWKEQVFEPTERSTDYSRLNRKVFTANVCIQVLEGMGEGLEVQNLLGEALFIRALAYFELAQLFLPSPMEGAEEIKIPVKLSPDVNQSPRWWTIGEVLAQAEKDLLDSFERMAADSQFKNRPNKKVVKAVLARLYLYTERWEEAQQAAEYVLEEESGKLMDYHELDSTRAYPFTLFNSEVLYYGITSSFSVTASAGTFINSDLIDQYTKGDLRKGLFFTSSNSEDYLYKGSYNGDYNLFTGIGLSEIYLTASEAMIRRGLVEQGLEVLGSLAAKRYQSQQDWEEQLTKDPLSLVLEERQKEQVFRGTRWMDMKRLRALGEFGTDPVREIEGQEFSFFALPEAYLPLPSYEMDLENR